MSLCQSPAGMDPEVEHGAQGRAVSWEWGKAMAVSNAQTSERNQQALGTAFPTLLCKKQPWSWCPQENGKSKFGKTWHECPGRKDNFLGKKKKDTKKTLDSSILAAPSMQMHWPFPQMELESQCELPSLAGVCQALALQSCLLLWLVAAARGLLRGEAKTDR